MSKLTVEEQVDLILKAAQFPDLGKRSNVKRNLIYVHTALGGTFIPVEETSNEAN